MIGKKRLLGSGIALCAIVLLGIQSAGAAVIVDETFADGDYTNNPTWTPVAGTFSVVNEELKMGMNGGVGISLALGDVQENSATNISFDLYAANLYATLFEFWVELVDSDTGTSQRVIGVAWPNVWGSLGGGGGSGFAAYGPNGEFGGGVVGASLNNGWQNMTIDFDPTTGVVVKRDGVVVSQWTNFNNQSKVDTVVFRTNSNDGTRDWTVDNVKVEGSLVPEPASMSILGLAGLLAACKRRK